jgi:hypothetical protein
MGVVEDIWRTYRRGPRLVVADHLARGPNEARAFAFLVLGCGLVWLGQWPRLMREAEAGRPDPEATFQQLAGTALVTWVMVMPLVFFGLAALTHAASRAMGGQGEPWAARVAVFWAWLAASPLALVAGLAAGFTGASVLANLLAILWIGVFAAFWASAQRESSGHAARV